MTRERFPENGRILKIFKSCLADILYLILTYEGDEESLDFISWLQLISLSQNTKKHLNS